MRIISDFKDYYDSAQAFGSDPGCAYLRKQERFEYELFAPHGEKKARMPRQLDQILRVPVELVTQLPHTIDQRIEYQRESLEIPITVKLIGFCGLLYPAIEIDQVTFYSTDKIADGLSTAYLRQFQITRKKLEELFARKSSDRRHWYLRWSPSALTHEAWKKSTADVVGKRFDEVFIQLGIPVFKVEFVARNKRHSKDKLRCTLNPHLKADGFQQVKGPFEAFQEISMYLGNQLARQLDPIAKVSDEIMRDEKGFDKWSFRRHKEEDKKHRKRKLKEQRS
ncbi:MAG: hypothetical protein HY706_00230 [Candidatus Hydrogenedentes bacterium]|nr:hypothetical protein [Candidatus Hydrogenedentota bacterium]